MDTGLVTAPGLDGDGLLRLIDGRTGGMQIIGAAGLAGEIRVAAADVTADGVADLVLAGVRGEDWVVSVLDGATGRRLWEAVVPGPGPGGRVTVGIDDVGGDGSGTVIAIVTGSRAAPLLRLFEAHTGREVPAPPP
jgi:hypothetical protein